MRPSFPPLLSILALVLFAPLCPAQPEPSIKTVAVSKGIYMLVGQGGNIGLCVGADGTFLIDDQFARMTKVIQEAVAKVSRTPVKFLVNTHLHGDHTGGNKNFNDSGAIIFAHENVRKRMSVAQLNKALGRTIPASPKQALPVITFVKALTFHWNGDEIRVFHVPNAHTDGDSIVHFKKANVVHMGDTYFNGMYPFIDVSSGGSVNGMIAAAERVLKLTDAKTRFIPGHGELSGRAGLQAFRAMLVTMRDRIKNLIQQGKNADQIVAAAPSKDFDQKWGQGFMKPERFLRGLVSDLTRLRP